VNARNTTIARRADPRVTTLLLACVVLAGCSAGSEDTASAARSAQTPAAAVAADSRSVRGLLLTDLRPVIPAAGPEDCPLGFNRNAAELLLASLPAAERAALAQDREALQARLGPFYYDDPRQDPCANPAAFADTGHYTVDRPRALQRLEPDGSVSERVLPPSSCPSAAAADPATRTIDNQYARVMGCVKGYQPGGLADSMADAYVTDGSLTILIEIAGPPPGVDGEVELGIYSSEEPAPVGGDGKPLANASLTISANARFHNRARGRITNGVLTTEPFDLRLIRAAQRLYSEYVLRDARLRLELHPDGSASGLLGGYWDIGWLSHASIRIQDRTGLSSGNPAALAHGYTCPGKYHAVLRLADGHPDPETGRCTTISTVNRLAAIPAFVLRPEKVAMGAPAAVTPPP